MAASSFTFWECKQVMKPLEQGILDTYTLALNTKCQSQTAPQAPSVQFI